MNLSLTKYRLILEKYFKGYISDTFKVEDVDFVGNNVISLNYLVKAGPGELWGIRSPSNDFEVFVENMDTAIGDTKLPLVLVGDWNVQERRAEVDEGKWFMIEEFLQDKLLKI